MNVVDSSGWIEYFRDAPNAAVFEPVVGDSNSVVVPTIAILEVVRHLRRWAGEEAADEAAAQMRTGLVVSLDAELAVKAATVSLRHKLPLADSIVLATAQAFEATLWTQDADFQHLPGVTYVPKKAE